MGTGGSSAWWQTENSSVGPGPLIRLVCRLVCTTVLLCGTNVDAAKVRACFAAQDNLSCLVGHDQGDSSSDHKDTGAGGEEAK
ncbi:MAG: hypothetical protein FRX49_09318 [Trebouxia sp. A1-2]|nr:MAG: hypothetical protein FRX49_09318 [Trebouxia sp. A1-2]